MSLGSIVRTYSGRLLLDVVAEFAASGDQSGGSRLPALRQSIPLVDGALATDPNLSGWLYQSGLQYSGATDILLAHATDPFQGAGNAVYSDPAFAVAGKKVKLLWVMAPATNSANINITRKSSNGFVGFVAASDGVTLSPGGCWLYYDPNGDVGGALSTGSNDGLTVLPASGTQELAVLVLYGA